jgi:hypothetical protein
LAVEEEGGIGEFSLGSLKEALKKISAGLRPVKGHPGPYLFGGSGRWPGVRELVG